METLPCAVIKDDLANKPLLVFMAGFPDNQQSALHGSIPIELSKEYNMVMLCMPGYEKGCKKIRPWAYSMDEILKLLDNTVTTHAKPEQPVYLMAHDWGAYFALIYVQKYPNKIKKVILLDIGAAAIGDLPLWDLCIIVIYQVWFAVSYILSQTLGHFIAMLVFFSFYFPWFRPIWPLIDERPSIPKEDMAVEKCYPYYYFWRNLLTLRTDMLPVTPSVPTLFMYGTKKNCSFHSAAFLRQLDQRDDCRQLAVQGGGHWFARTHQEIVIKEVLAFLARS